MTTGRINQVATVRPRRRRDCAATGEGPPPPRWRGDDVGHCSRSRFSLDASVVRGWPARLCSRFDLEAFRLPPVSVRTRSLPGWLRRSAAAPLWHRWSRPRRPALHRCNRLSLSLSRPGRRLKRSPFCRKQFSTAREACTPLKTVRTQHTTRGF